MLWQGWFSHGLSSAGLPPEVSHTPSVCLPPLTLPASLDLASVPSPSCSSGHQAARWPCLSSELCPLDALPLMPVLTPALKGLHALGTVLASSQFESLVAFKGRRQTMAGVAQ